LGRIASTDGRLALWRRNGTFEWWCKGLIYCCLNLPNKYFEVEMCEKCETNCLYQKNDSK
jgi:hypothetical protein